MNRTHPIITSALVATLAVSFSGIASAQVAQPVAPMAQPTHLRGDCQSGHNLAHVHRRLDGTIDQLQHDQQDYQGHRVKAISDLQAARTEIIAGEQSAENTQGDSGSCFKTHGPTGGGDQNWGKRPQGWSNSNLMNARHSVQRMVEELKSDQRDYGGHRVAAISDMERARAELDAAHDDGSVAKPQ